MRNDYITMETQVMTLPPNLNITQENPNNSVLFICPQWPQDVFRLEIGFIITLYQSIHTVYIHYVTPHAETDFYIMFSNTNITKYL